MKITERQLRRIICEAVISPDLEARVMGEMGEYAPGSLDEWEDYDFLTYLYEISDALDHESVQYEATVEYVKARFPEVTQEVDELFSEGGPRDMPPPFEAFNDLVYNNVDIIGGSQDVLSGEEHTVRASNVKSDDGTYRWWIWGNNLDPVDIDVGATGTDRDGKMWTAEDIFQTVRGGKASRFRVPATRAEDLY